MVKTQWGVAYKITKEEDKKDALLVSDYYISVLINILVYMIFEGNCLVSIWK